MGALIESVKRLTFEAIRVGLNDEKSVFDRVKKRLAETLDIDPKRKCCVRASSMPPSVCAAVREAFGDAKRLKSGIQKISDRNTPFAKGPKACPNAGCSGLLNTPNSFATHASRCTHRPR
jgi:hypothetical protein